MASEQHQEPDVIGLSVLAGFGSFSVTDALHWHHPILAFTLGAGAAFLLFVILLTWLAKHE